MRHTAEKSRCYAPARRNKRDEINLRRAASFQPRRPVPWNQSAGARSALAKTQLAGKGAKGWSLRVLGTGEDGDRRASVSSCRAIRSSGDWASWGRREQKEEGCKTTYGGWECRIAPHPIHRIDALQRASSRTHRHREATDSEQGTITASRDRRRTRQRGRRWPEAAGRRR